MRSGIVGNIYGYHEHGHESHGQGLEQDAAQISREFPGQTVKLDRPDGKTQWFEGGEKIPAPQWDDD